MFEVIRDIPFSVAALLPVVNPLGSAVIFLSVSAGLSERTIKNLCLRIAINAFVLLTVVLLTGSWILRFFGISVPIVQIGGGLVVGYLSWTLLHHIGHDGKYTHYHVRNDQDAETMSFYPLTMPLTADPGAIAVALALGAHGIRSTFYKTITMQIGAVLGIGVVATCIYFAYVYAHRVTRSLGPAGMQVIFRLSAFINLCIGLEIIWQGVSGLMFEFWGP